MYREFALPYEKRLVETVHAMGALARLHIRGDTTRLLPNMVTGGADIVDLDWMVFAPPLFSFSILSRIFLTLLGLHSTPLFSPFLPLSSVVFPWHYILSTWS
jgi:hypothetical protein